MFFHYIRATAVSPSPGSVSIMHLRHTAVAHISTSFSHFPLAERLKGYLSGLKGRSKAKATHPAIFSSFICNETDNNKRNNRDPGKDTETDREHFELPAGDLFLRTLSLYSRWGRGDQRGDRAISKRRRQCDWYIRR